MVRKDSRSDKVNIRRPKKYKYPNGHDPTLRTIRMVEETLKKKKFLSSKNQLYQVLGKRVMQQTLSKILVYLEESNKITYNNRSITWVFEKSVKPRKKLEEPIKSKLNFRKSRK
jgi:hypothetical protein